MPSPHNSSNNHQGPNMALKERHIRKLVSILLRHCPGLVLVKTTSPEEKQTLVELLQSAGGTVIYRDGKASGDKQSDEKSKV
jgi:hypothetical protein